MSSRTPGPWKAEFRNGWCDGIIGPDGHDIVKTDSGVYPPNEADAHLIAAAPELLAACEATLNSLEESCVEEDEDDALLHLLWQVRAAVARAHGQ